MKASDLILKLFGWLSITFIIAFLIDNVMQVGFDFPGILTLFKKFSFLAIIELLIYIIIALITIYYVRKKSISYRTDSIILHNLNLYLIRSFFWIVLIIGIVDITIAFMRVEKIFDLFLSKQFVSNFSRPVFVGLYFHIPLIFLGFIVAKYTKTIGFHWLSLLIVASELIIVITRFVFSYEQTFMGDLVRYWYAGLFLFASAYTLYEDGHVRVDILYQGLKDKTKYLLNSVGSILLGWTTSIVIIFVGFNGKQSIINSPITNFEVTQQGSVGMFIKYHMAVFLGIFGITMLIQFISYFFESIADYKNEKGKRVVTNSSGY